VDVGLIASAQHAPNLRHWRDLSKWRLLFGLAFAPVLPIALGALVLLSLAGGIFIGALGGILAAAETWSMLVGTVFLIAARYRGVVRRAHCFLLGAFLAFSLPSAAYVASAAVDRVFAMTSPSEISDEDFEEGFLGPSDGTFVFVVGLILIPFGTFGGWVFWRVGVRPARPKVIDVAPVFD